MNFSWGEKTYIMGIINVTPDSFSGDGILGADEAVQTAALAQAREFVSAGADILDIGGESSRPGAEPISPQQELSRILPVIQAIRAEFSGPISVDTYRAEVAEAALSAGASWINDIWGLRMDSALAPLLARRNCPVVLMHNRFAPRNQAEARQLAGQKHGSQYEDVLAEVYSELSALIERALAQGIQPENIIIDPGIGFGKSPAHNLRLINDLGHFKSLGYPILLGTSRKGFIGRLLNQPPDQRVAGTAATIAIGIDRGADIVRVHDVAVMAQVAKMTDFLVR